MHLIYGVHTAIVYCVYEPFLNGSFDTFHKPAGFFSLKSGRIILSELCFILFYGSWTLTIHKWLKYASAYNERFYHVHRTNH